MSDWEDDLGYVPGPDYKTGELDKRLLPEYREVVSELLRRETRRGAALDERQRLMARKQLGTLSKPDFDHARSVMEGWD